MMRRLFRMHRGQEGITGLETAIILIAFVVVAAVFAYTVLTAGLFSTQKSQEAIYAGLAETQSTLEQRGAVVAYKGDANISSYVGKVEITLGSAMASGEAIDLTPPYSLAGGALVPSGLENPTQLAYNDSNVTIANMVWTLRWIGNNNNDYYLDVRESAVITAWFHSYDGSIWSYGSTANGFLGTDNVTTDHTFTVEIKPAVGAVLTIERTTPAYLDTVMDLH